MSAPNYHLMSEKSGSELNINTDGKGKYHSPIKMAGGETIGFTGSNAGFGAIILSGESAIANTKITLNNGVVIDGDDLVADTLYEFSINKVLSHTGVSYVFKKRGI